MWHSGFVLIQCLMVGGSWEKSEKSKLVIAI